MTLLTQTVLKILLILQNQTAIMGGKNYLVSAYTRLLHEITDCKLELQDFIMCLVQREHGVMVGKKHLLLFAER